MTSEAALKEAIAADKKKGDPSPPRLFASKEDIEKLGWIAAAMPGWAGMDVILLSNDDLLSASEQQRVLHPPPRPNVPLMTAEILALDKEGDNLLRDGAKHYLDTFPELPKNDPVLQGEITARADTALHQGAASKKVSSDAGTFCIVTMPATGLQAKDYAAMLSGVPSGKLKNIPGTGQEWLSLFMAHETAHCTQPPVSIKASTTGETDADQKALHAYFSNLAAGKVHSDAVPAAMVDMRALAALGSNAAHRTSAGLELNDKKAAASEEEEKAASGSFTSVYNAVVDAVARTGEMARDDAYDAVLRVPGLFYETLKVLDHRGAFKDEPLQQKYASQYLDAIKNHVDGGFAEPDQVQAIIKKINENNRPSPATFDPLSPSPSFTPR